MLPALAWNTANYYCVSVFRESTAGHFVRRAECFDGQFAIVIDDVGTKINLKELLRVIPLPTYVLETSPGNFHYGFKITNGRDARVIAALIDSIISDELINPSLRDPGMVGVTRVVRLPVGANCKPAVVAANGGKPWPHVMHVWEPSRAYTVEQMAEELDVDISPEALARFKGGGHTRKATAAEVGIDPLMKLFDARGMLIDATPNDNGFVAIKCPWAADHSDARDEAGYRPGSGGFQCHHGHCEGKGMNELRAWVEEAFTGAERAAALAETFGPVDENDPVLQGEIRRAEERHMAKVEAAGGGGGHALHTCSDGLPDIPGGAYPADELLPAISARFALVDREGEVNVVHRDAAGADHVLARGSFESYLANVAVKTQNDNGDEKFFPAAKWWKAHPKRPPIRRAIFDPHRTARIDEYNFWRGFGVAPIQGRDKIKSFLAHLWVVIARRDRRKFKYIVRWLSWAVQNPEKRAETVIVLKSESEGSGKSTVSDAMRVIFGKHAVSISDPAEIVGTHVDDIEFASFVQLEEALFAGDPKTADKIKHSITGATLRINPKGRKAYQALNRLHAILTTNHAWSVPAGRDARRWFICEVSDEKVGDRAWFDKIYDDLQAGGYGQLLHYLQRKKLGSFHPRNMPRTFELAEQQIRSASSIHQWLLSCAADGAIEAYERGVRKEHLQLELGADHATTKLYDAYAGAQRMQGGRVDQKIHFARMLAKILGENARVRHAGDRNCRGFHIPQADELTQLVNLSLGICERVTDGARECNRRADVDDDDGGPF
nr:DUF5906 domain-containing protein [Methylocystis sp. ATCC 49242]